MTKIKRYYPETIEVQSEMLEDKDGGYVSYDDYARVEAERDAAKRCWDSMKEEWDKLVKENIRLRKAGDAIVDEGEVMARDVSFVTSVWDNRVADWNAAKEVQP